MIDSVTVTNHLGESIRLDLDDPWSSGFIIRKIDGLGAPKADIIFTEIATNDGGIDNSARVETRNIVFSLWFLESDTIEETRLKTYKYFPIKHNITLRFDTDNRSCEIVGRVESNTPSIFDKQEGCQISVVCPDPYFISRRNNQKVFYGTDPMFEFPFCNDSLEEKLLLMGTIEHHTEGVIVYDGDAETGITIYIHAIGIATGLSIYNLKNREIMRIDDQKLMALTGEGIHAGDEITIDTRSGQKSITLLRGGIETNILNTLGRPITWFKLSKGDNVFAYTAKTGLENLQFRIDSRVLFEGV